MADDPTSPVSLRIWPLNFSSGSDFVPYSVAVPGDVDGNGADELLIAALGRADPITGTTRQEYLHFSDPVFVTSAVEFSAAQLADTAERIPSPVPVSFRFNDPFDLDGDGRSEVLRIDFGGEGTGDDVLFAQGGYADEAEAVNGFEDGPEDTGFRTAIPGGIELGSGLLFFSDLNGDGADEAVRFRTQQGTQTDLRFAVTDGGDPQPPFLPEFPGGTPAFPSTGGRMIELSFADMGLTSQVNNIFANGIGDVNGDGNEDIGFNINFDAFSTVGRGGGYGVIYGGTTAAADIADRSGGYIITGNAQEASIRGPVLPIGDVNADGLDDVFVGAAAGLPGFETNFGYIVFGSTDRGIGGSGPLTLASQFEDQRLSGGSVVALQTASRDSVGFERIFDVASGDFDNDGRGDVAFLFGEGVMSDGSRAQGGAVYVLFGGTELSAPGREAIVVESTDLTASTPVDGFALFGDPTSQLREIETLRRSSREDQLVLSGYDDINPADGLVGGQAFVVAFDDTREADGGLTAALPDPTAARTEIVVTTDADVVDPSDGETSLREAVIQANALSGPALITLRPGPDFQIYELARMQAPANPFAEALPQEARAEFGDLDIFNDIVLRGPARIDARELRIFHVHEGGALGLDTLTVAGGVVGESRSSDLPGDGGVVLVENGGLAANDVEFIGGRLTDVINDYPPNAKSVSGAPSRGGAILNEGGTVAIADSEFHQNSAARGGAIYNTGTLAIAETEFSNNVALRDVATGSKANLFAPGETAFQVIESDPGAALIRNSGSGIVDITSGNLFGANSVRDFDDFSPSDDAPDVLLAGPDGSIYVSEDVFLRSGEGIGVTATGPLRTEAMDEIAQARALAGVTGTPAAFTAVTAATLFVDTGQEIGSVDGPSQPLIESQSAAAQTSLFSVDGGAADEDPSQAVQDSPGAPGDPATLILAASADLGLAPDQLGPYLLAPDTAVSVTPTEITITLAERTVVLQGTGLAYAGDFLTIALNATTLDEILAPASGTVTAATLLDDTGQEIGSVTGLSQPLTKLLSAAAQTGRDPGDGIPALFGTDLSQAGSQGNDRLVGTDGGELIDAAAGNDSVEAGAGNDSVTGGTGLDEIDLGTGLDQVFGPLAAFFGDVISGFGADDELVFSGERLDRDQFDVTDGSAIIAVDANRDGTSDGSFVLQGDFSGGAFMSVIRGADTVMTFEALLRALSEGTSLTEAEVNGIVNRAFLTGDTDRDFTVTLDIPAIGSMASYNNVVGAYEVAPDGTITDVQILFGNHNAQRGETARITDVDPGHSLGFFIVQDGADWFATLSNSDGFSFAAQDGAPAQVSDGAGISLAVNGVDAGQTVFHSTDASLNADGLEHVLSGARADGQALQIGFEDLLGGGDRDFQDVLLAVSVEAAPVLL